MLGIEVFLSTVSWVFLLTHVRMHQLGYFNWHVVWQSWSVFGDNSVGVSTELGNSCIFIKTKLGY